MSVVVKRKPVKQPPPLEIAAGTENLSWNGNTVVFRPVRGVSAGELALEVQTRPVDDSRGRGCLAHLDPADARSLAAALVEWAYAVDPDGAPGAQA